MCPQKKNCPWIRAFVLATTCSQRLRWMRCILHSTVDFLFFFKCWDLEHPRLREQLPTESMWAAFLIRWWAHQGNSNPEYRSISLLERSRQVGRWIKWNVSRKQVELCVEERSLDTVLGLQLIQHSKWSVWTRCSNLTVALEHARDARGGKKRFKTS
jgi:hypothetical protein